MSFDLNTATQDTEYNGSFDLSTAIKDDNEWTISAYKPPSIMDRVKNAWSYLSEVPVAAFQEQTKNNQAAELRTKGVFLRKIGQDLSQEDKDKIALLDNPYNQGRYNQANNYQIPEYEYIYKSPSNFLPRAANNIKKFYADASKQTGIYYSILKDLGIGAAVGAGGGGLIGAVATRTPQGTLAGAKTGATLLARTAVAKKSFELETGFMRQELEGLNAEFISEGIEPLSDIEMDNFALGAGALNATLEYLGVKEVLKTVPNGDKILGSFGKEGIKKLAKDKAFRAELSELSAKLLAAGITEGSTEAIQEYVNFIYANKARELKGVIPQPLAEKIDDIMYSGLIGSVCAMTMGGVGTASQVAAIKTKQGFDKIAAKKEADNMTIDERNDFINENIDTLAEIAQEQADEKIKSLNGEDTYTRIKNEMERQGATAEMADSSGQLVQQAYNVITDKFGKEGQELLAKSNLQVLINNSSKAQLSEEKTFVDNSLKNRESQTFKPSELLTDAKTFQYKENSDADGVTDRMLGVEEFDPLYAGKVIVYQTKDGKKYIVDGHQRLGLAKRLGGDNIELEGFLFKEEDGYTPEQMRLLAAQKNIAEGSGTAIDTAKIIKEIGLENLPKTIPTNSVMVKNGISLSKLGDTAFQKVVNGAIEMNEAAIVAEILRNDEAKQNAAIDQINKLAQNEKTKLKNLNQIELFCNEVLATDIRVSEQTNLFGNFEVFETLAIEKIQLVDKAIKSLQSDKKIFGNLLRNDNKIKGRGKNKLDKETNARIAQEAAVAVDLIKKLASYAGVVADKANQLATMVKNEELTIDEAAKEFKAYVLSPDVASQIYGKVKQEITYNQAAIGRKISTDRNIYTALETEEQSEETLISPEEFYRKGLYQSAKADELQNWRAKYPDVAEATAQLEQLEAEGKLPPTCDINTEERQQLRKDIIHELYNYGEGAKNKNKQAYLIIGSPATGKSSIIENMNLRKDTGSLVIDSDDAKARLPEMIKYGGVRANQVHKESQKIAESLLNLAIQNGDNVILPIVGKSEKSVLKKYELLEAAGYEVHLKLMYLPVEETVDRAVNRYRATGRLVPLDYVINEVGLKPLETYVKMKEKGLFKSYEAFSNEVEYGQDPKPITEEDINVILGSNQHRLQQDEIQGRNRLDERSVRGRNDNRGLSFNQDNEAPRGVFRIDENGTAIINILENGDASTIVHELGHFYLYALETLANGGNLRAEKELKEVNKWLGKADDIQYTQEQLVEFHEKFASGFELYLMEGTAPTKSLLNVFQNFKAWLRDVYKSAKEIDIEFSEAAQMLFDRVFTTDEEYEQQVLPKYQYNYARAIQVQQAVNEPSYKVKKALKETSSKFSLWYDKLFLPIETRLGKIAPALKEKLRNHTAKLALIKGKDLHIAADFFKKTEAMKNTNIEDYIKLDLALKNRDEHTVRILATQYDFLKEFEDIREMLEDIYNEALSVGLDVGYLENYYPRLVKDDLTEKFIEYIESLARKEQMDVINQIIKTEDAKISMILRDLQDADPNGFWGTQDKAKFINNRIRGFGRNNILLSRNASLKFERSIDELDGDLNQFYETFEPALVSYIANSRETIEARKFFGSENKEVSKLRARIKRKKATLEEVKERKPHIAKGKEIDRIKYELNPLKVKLEHFEGKEDLFPEQEEYRKNLEKKVARLERQIEFVEKLKPLSAKNMVIKRYKTEIEEAAKEIKNILGDEENVEDSIGALITQLSSKGEIYVKDEKLIREMLLARFNASRACEPIKIVRDLSYIATLNDITNAITQFGDLAFSVYKYGFENTFKGIKKPFEITKEDLGLNDMAYEFSNPSLLSNWLKKQFKWIGLNAIDGLGKNTIIQASLLNAQKKIKANNPEFLEKLKRIYGEDVEIVKKDLLDGKATDDTIIFAFHELSDIQPISEDQTTELYQSGGGYLKLFYTLKTYGIKALDVARNDITNNIHQGLMNKNKGQVKKGFQNLIKLQMLLWLFGVPIDALKDLLSNRDINIFESMIDTLIPFFIISRFMIKDVFSSGIGTAIANFFTPPIFSTSKKALSGKASAVSHIPIIGKPIYNWFLKDK